MQGFYHEIEELALDAFPGLTFSGWLEIEHDHIDGFYVLRVWLDNGAKGNIACPDAIADAIKLQVHNDDKLMGLINEEGKYHNE